MARRSSARWLAPIAIVAVGVAAYGIVKSGSGDATSSRGTARPSSQRPAEGETTTTDAQPAQRSYVVRSGDTLSSISLETGVAVARLQALNPDIDVQALQPGQRLRLRR